MLADRNVDLIGDHVDMAVRIGKLPDSSMVATQIGVMRTVDMRQPDAPCRSWYAADPR